MPAETETMRRLRQKQRKVYKDTDEHEEDEIAPRTFRVEDHILSDKYDADFVLEMQATDITQKLFQETGFRTPMIIKDKTGLGMRVPSENFTVSDAKRCVGSRRIIDVMDVLTQKGVTMSMKEYVQYYEDTSDRDRLLNVISLEFSHTKLETYVEQPKVVQQVDWVDTVWPAYLKEQQTETTNIIERMKYPKVQRYCLMSVAGCYTDFHIDMGGTSVWYHLLKGEKTFWLIPPTDENLKMYETWTLSGKQGDEFFGDRVKECQRITLQAGWTFMIPTGWIHAVHTPQDSLVFGGNFLHIYNAPMQLRVWNIESKTHVEKPCRYPFFTEIHWYVLERYVSTLLGRNHLKIPKDEEEEENDDVQSTSSHQTYSSEITCVAKTRNFTKPEVHLTRFELEGIRDIIAWLDGLAPTKKLVPKDIPYPAGLLADAKQMLKEHANDDPTLALCSESTLKWLQKKPTAASAKKTTTTNYRSKATGGKSTKQPAVNRSVTSAPHRRRRVRCRQCEPCTRSDCRECVFCHDMKKFGGPGTSKQSCMSRKCLGPILPNNALCRLCEDKEEEFYECCICWYIYHPSCFNKQYEIDADIGIINEDLPNSWECPKCVQKGLEGTSQARIPKAVLEAKAHAQGKAEEDKEEETEDEDVDTSHPAPPVFKSTIRLSICRLDQQKPTCSEKPTCSVFPQKPVQIVSPQRSVPSASSSAQKIIGKKPVACVSPMKQEISQTRSPMSTNRVSPLSPMLSSMEAKKRASVPENKDGTQGGKDILQSGFQRVVDREPVLETLQKCLDFTKTPTISIPRIDAKTNPKNIRAPQNNAGRKTEDHNGDSPNKYTSMQFNAEEWNRSRKRKRSDTEEEATAGGGADESGLEYQDDEDEDDDVDGMDYEETESKSKKRRMNFTGAAISQTPSSTTATYRKNPPPTNTTTSNNNTNNMKSQTIGNGVKVNKFYSVSSKNSEVNGNNGNKTASMDYMSTSSQRSTSSSRMSMRSSSQTSSRSNSFSSTSPSPQDSTQGSRTKNRTQKSQNSTPSGSRLSPELESSARTNARRKGETNSPTTFRKYLRIHPPGITGELPMHLKRKFLYSDDEHSYSLPQKQVVASSSKSPTTIVVSRPTPSVVSRPTPSVVLKPPTTVVSKSNIVVSRPSPTVLLKSPTGVSKSNTVVQRSPMVLLKSLKSPATVVSKPSSTIVSRPSATVVSKSLLTVVGKSPATLQCKSPATVVSRSLLTIGSRPTSTTVSKSHSVVSRSPILVSNPSSTTNVSRSLLTVRSRPTATIVSKPNPTTHRGSKPQPPSTGAVPRKATTMSAPAVSRSPTFVASKPAPSRLVSKPPPPAPSSVEPKRTSAPLVSMNAAKEAAKNNPGAVVLSKVKCNKMNHEGMMRVNSRGRAISLPTRYLE